MFKTRKLWFRLWNTHKNFMPAAANTDGAGDDYNLSLCGLGLKNWDFLMRSNDIKYLHVKESSLVIDTI